MDYRALLVKYIAHVIDCESIDFLDSGHNHPFTDEEMAELQGMSREVRGEPHTGFVRNAVWVTEPDASGETVANVTQIWPEDVE